VRAAFRASSGETTDAAWHLRNDRDVLDLRQAVRSLLHASGVERVTLIGPCTKCSPDFCSYRRDGADAGRQVSFIGWT
jgi:copper oxidase (laccase) domain-containing protein